MDKLRIIGGHQLNGTIRVAGAKNAALPLMTAALLTADELILENTPALADVEGLLSLLAILGVESRFDYDSKTLSLKAQEIKDHVAPYEIVRKMRASILVLGPLLARHGHARVSLPGGCAIGTRPVDLHIKGLERLGAEITLAEGYIEARAPNGLVGGEFTFSSVSVTGTENVLMAACLARGETILRNAAREPEVVDLCHCLQKMGAQIDGVGTDTLHIQGVSRLHGARHQVIGDRIEAGSYAIAAAITHGKIILDGIDHTVLSAPIEILRQVGVQVDSHDNGFTIDARNKSLKGVDLITEPYPGLATDLQAQFMSLMTVASGASMITEAIFENRFMHVPELARMGADIHVHGSVATVRGGNPLTGAQVMATDLRASMSLVLAGMVAQGETVISRIYHLDRGYEDVESKLGNCGAEIYRIRGEDDATYV